jgi:hypothetical protein
MLAHGTLGCTLSACTPCCVWLCDCSQASMASSRDGVSLYVQ